MEELHVIDALPAYALGCLDKAEERQVALHLERCSFCQEMLKGYQMVTEQLPLVTPLHTPPPELKAAILRQVKPHRESSQVEKPGWAESLRGFFQRYTPMWGLVSLVLIAALGVSNLLLWQQVQRSTQPQTDGFSVVGLTGEASSPQATGWLVISPDGQYGTVIVDSLPELDESHEYQVWLIDGEERISGGVFSVGHSGYGALEVWTEQPLASFDRVGITIEPAGGSPDPTGERVMVGEF